MKSAFLANARKLVKLGDRFLSQNNQNVFHQEAAELLSRANLHKLYDYKKIVTESFGKDFSHEQNFKSFEFSDLPLTIARGEHCFIDLYFWRRRPTTIHNHHFTGAFQCLYGSNVDSEFSFIPEKKVTRIHTLGTLTETRRRDVKPGDIEAINFQDKFIHQNHHHADLTVNLCFRTPDRKGKSLANFYYSGFKYEKNPEALKLARRLYAFSQIEDFDFKKIKISPEAALSFLLETLGATSHPRTVNIQKTLLKRMKSETGIDVQKLIRVHDEKLDSIQSDYE